MASFERSYIPAKGSDGAHAIPHHEDEAAPSPVHRRTKDDTLVSQQNQEKERVSFVSQQTHTVSSIQEEADDRGHQGAMPLDIPIIQRRAVQCHRRPRSFKALLQAHIDGQHSTECRECFLQPFIRDAVTVLMQRQHSNFSTHWTMADLVSECCQLCVQIAVPLLSSDSRSRRRLYCTVCPI